MPIIEVYSREGCHLCEILIEDLLNLTRGRADVRVQDIESRPDWLQKYDIRVPVVELDGAVLSEVSLDRDRVLEALAGLAEQG
jgi:predicted thioredoxin/glutaredoxin